MTAKATFVKEGAMNKILLENIISFKIFPQCRVQHEKS